MAYVRHNPGCSKRAALRGTGRVTGSAQDLLDELIAKRSIECRHNGSASSLWLATAIPQSAAHLDYRPKPTADDDPRGYALMKLREMLGSHSLGEAGLGLAGWLMFSEYHSEHFADVLMATEVVAMWEEHIAPYREVPGVYSPNDHQTNENAP